MALTPEQKSSRLFKKSLGAAETILARDFFEEPKLGNTNILPSQIWAEADDIPTTAPSLTNGEILGVVQYLEKLELTFISGSVESGDDASYFHDSLKDTIPFNYSDGSYNYALYKNDGSTVIPFGSGDWLVDTSAGVLTFYGTVPSGVDSGAPPKISFYKYVGDKGLQISGATSGLNIKDPSVYATREELSGTTYSPSLSGFTTLPTEVDGVTGFTEGQRILVKNQADEVENGIYIVSGTTLVRAVDHDGQPIGEVGVNDYTFVLSGTTLMATAWVLSSTDAANPDKIIVGQDTQGWSLFSQSLAYQADGLGLKLQGDTFYIEIDDNGTESGLEQNVDGIKVKTTLINQISGNTDDIATLSGQTESLSTALSSEIVTRSGETLSLSTALSSEVVARISGDTSLSTALSGETSTRISGDLSLSTALSGETSTRLSGDLSLSTALSGETDTRISGDTSLQTAIDNIQALSADNAGSGLTYLSGGTAPTLNVNVDEYTIKIIDDELRTPETWMEFDATTTISGGTSGATNIVLDYDSVGYVSAYVNGVEYLVSTTSSPSTNQPFFFDSAIPTVGSTLWFDPTTAGFDLESGVDVIQIKYHYISEIII